MTARNADVVLVSMPFGPLYQPSIGLGLLKASLNRLGVPGKVNYFTLRFAERIGNDLYGRIATGYPLTTDLVGEWLFSHLLFPESQLRPGFVDDILRPHCASGQVDPKILEEFVDALPFVQREADPFLDDCVSDVLASRPRIVGFTSVFPQQVPSLALARRIKARAPEVAILFGGPNCEGVMGREMARQFPFLDAVVSGEADVVFPELVTRLLDEAPISGLPGVHLSHATPHAGKGRTFLAVNTTAESDECASLNAAVAPDLNRLEYPDYDDFFDQALPHPNRRHKLGLLMETSRGCWWGEKHHCSFCGLNGADMSFRSKSADRAFQELTHLLDKYPSSYVGVVDNILDMKYFREFLPRLAAAGLDVELFYEVKPNLTKDQVRLLRKAGVTSIQPGIESFSDQVLALMKKGVTGLQNVQLLKWCAELGIYPKWNILWGFPGEDPEEYARMARLLPLLTHLPRPALVGSIYIVRFSPNFEDSEGHGFSHVEPYPAYKYVYPFPADVLANLAFTFTYRYREPRDLDGYTAPVLQAARPWGFVPSYLFSLEVDGRLLICDLRPSSDQPLFALSGLQRKLYEACDGVRSVTALQKMVDGDTDDEGERWGAAELLAPLVEAGLMVVDGDRYLSLAIPMGVYSPDASAAVELVRVVRRRGESASDVVFVPLPELQPAGRTAVATTHSGADRAAPESLPPDSAMAQWTAVFAIDPSGRGVNVDLSVARQIRREREDAVARDAQRERILAALRHLD